MPAVRLLIGLFLVGVAVYVCVCNVALVYRWFFRNKRSSLVFVVGGLVGMAGLIVLPVEIAHGWFWIWPIADIVIPYLACLGFYTVKKASRQ